MVCRLAQMTSRAEPTPFHHMLASLASEGRLMRLYTQNIDYLDTRMPPLTTAIPLNAKGPWPTTVQLHGGLEKMVCATCNHLEPFTPSLFAGPDPPPCQACTEQDRVRTTSGKRSRGIGRLRPRIVLYNEYNPDEEAIGNASKADLRRVPDAVIVVGTSLKTPGVRRIVKEMCQLTRSRRDGITAWINLDPEPQGVELKDCWDLVVRGKCDDIASLVNLPRWDQQEDIGDGETYMFTGEEQKVMRPTDAWNRDNIEVLPPTAPKSPFQTNTKATCNDDLALPRFMGSPSQPELSGQLWENPLPNSNNVRQGTPAHATCPAPDRSLIRPNELAASKNTSEPPSRGNTPPWTKAPGTQSRAERRARTRDALTDALKNHFVPVIDLTRDGTLSPAAGRVQATTRGALQAGHTADTSTIIDLTGD